MTQNFYTPDKACAVFLHRLVGVCFSLTTFYEFGRLAYLITSLPAIPSIPPPPERFTRIVNQTLFVLFLLIHSTP